MARASPLASRVRERARARWSLLFLRERQEAGGRGAWGGTPRPGCLSSAVWLAPNGSRLSCGRLARRRKAVGRQAVPARAQHSGSFKTITARQLQALVRRFAAVATPACGAAEPGRGRATPR